MRRKCRCHSGVFTVVVTALILSACGGEMVVKPGDPAVYEQIEAMTSCHRLRERAEQDLGALTDDGEQREAQVAYALAANNRMKELGCD